MMTIEQLWEKLRLNKKHPKRNEWYHVAWKKITHSRLLSIVLAGVAFDMRRIWELIPPGGDDLPIGDARKYVALGIAGEGVYPCEFV